MNENLKTVYIGFLDLKTVMKGKQLEAANDRIGDGHKTNENTFWFESYLNFTTMEPVVSQAQQQNSPLEQCGAEII